MKKILFRKILLDCSIFFLIALISSSIIVWVFQAVNFLDIVIEDGRNYLVYINYTLLNFPKIISKLIPFTLFFSFWYTLNKYENKNELIIFSIHGVNKLQIINFFLRFSFIVIIFQIILTSLIIPKTQDLAKSVLRKSEINFFGNFMKSKKFNDIIKNLTIYVESKDEYGKLKNIYLKKKSDNQSQITYAKNGEIKIVNYIPILFLYEGETININNYDVSKFNFSQSNFNLSNLESNTTTYIKLQETTSLILIKCIFYHLNDSKTKEYKAANCSNQGLGEVYKEFYKRFFIPLYIPILILISLLTINNSKENINHFKNKIFIFLFGLLTIIISESTLGYVNKSLSTNLIFIFIPIVFLIILYLIIYNKLTFKLIKK